LSDNDRIIEHKNPLTTPSDSAVRTHLSNVISFHGKMNEYGLSFKGATVLCYILQNENCTLFDLSEAGIAGDHYDSMSSLFRSCKPTVRELLDSKLSGKREIGKIFTLTTMGREIALELMRTLSGEK
jgi:hypothetical protein